MDQDPSVAVVIPVLNGADRLAAALESVLAQTYPAAEIIVSIGPSTDGTEERARHMADVHPQIQLVENPTGRTPDALNIAIGASSSDVVARVDAGSVLPPDYLERAIATLLDTGAANVGAVQHAVGTTPFERTLAAALGTSFGAGNASYRFDGGAPRKVETAWLGVFWRSALDAVGGYDTRFTRNQDYELNWRLGSTMNGVWLDPALSVDYRPRSTLKALASQYWQYGWWRAQTVRTHPDSLKVRQLAAPVLVIALAGSAGAGAMGFRRLAALVPTIYTGATIAATATTPGDLSGSERLRMLVIYPAMHLPWGAGLLVSILRRRGR